MDKFKKIVIIASAVVMGIGFSISGALPLEAACPGTGCGTCSCCEQDGNLVRDGGTSPLGCVKHACIPPGGCDGVT